MTELLETIKRIARETREEELATLVVESAVGDARVACARLYVEGRLLATCARGEPSDDTATFVELRNGDHVCGQLAVVGLDAAGMHRVQLLAPHVAIALDATRLFADLERAVDQEMRTAVERENEMRLVLDSMGEGLVVIDAHGCATEIRSRVIEDWFGPLAAGARVGAHLFREANAAQWFDLALDELVNGLLPFEVRVGQMPQKLLRDGRVFALGYRMVEGEREPRILVSVRDVTAAIAAEQADRAQREFAVLVSHLLRDRRAFRAFVGEMESLLAALAGLPSPEGTRRILHTLKGSSAMYGIESFAKSCHAIEDELADGVTFAAAHAERLHRSWHETFARMEAFLHDDGGLQVSREEHAAVIERLRTRSDHQQILDLVRSWQRDRVDNVLAPVIAQARRSGEALGRAVDIHVHGARIRLPDARLHALFPQLVHLLRNAVDHGIEPRAERIARGKPAAGRIDIFVRSDPDAFHVMVADDGRGIAWDRVRDSAALRGLPHQRHEDLVAALFADGLSTRDAVTELSGRGVGMSAVRAAVESAGGSIHVESGDGTGTRWSLSVPISPCCEEREEEDAIGNARRDLPGEHRARAADARIDPAAHAAAAQDVGF